MKLRYSDVTPKRVYLNRRELLGAMLAAAAPKRFEGIPKGPFGTADTLTPYQNVTTYNNFYELGTGKDQPVQLARKFRTSPWAISVQGLVAKPRTLDLDEVMKLAPVEERIYRMRCVEGWSMVIPWVGFPLSALIGAANPAPSARYVAFESYYDPAQMPQARFAGLPFPYKEGLRMDEAMHPLTILAVGLYGEVLPNQNGAPLRLVVPWKYGFKSIKSISRITFTSERPRTTWSDANPREYGFYSNVNPTVDHPRWSQAKERRIGEFGKRQTLLFNGYAGEVADLYTGLDLWKNY